MVQRQRGTLTLSDVLNEDSLATSIARKWAHWDSLRQKKKNEWQEVRNYLYATDTSTTTNATLPWRNKTTTPKLTQIKDNLLANYRQALFPRRNWLRWVPGDRETFDKDKREAIELFMQHVVSQPHFENTLERLIDDFIDYGNAFCMSDWWDDSYERDKDASLIYDYVGPTASRISPENIVFDPTAPNFYTTPKIIRSFLTFGDLETKLEAKTVENENTREKVEAILDYMKELRKLTSLGEIENFDESYSMDGFGSFRDYLLSGVVEVLTFYGDIYDENSGEFKRNRIITVVDRHKLIMEEENPSFFANPRIFHVAWRTRRDNLWGMGPLDNLVGLQYRIDHLENIKADALDLTVFPPLFIKGVVEDFKWGPMQMIRTSDPNGSVSLMGPDASVLNVNLEIERILNLMEEMAGAPKEAMGFRTPGEKTAFEVQRLETAASRVFHSKIIKFERDLLEPLLNSMLELARRNYTNVVSFVASKDREKINEFITLTVDDIKSSGRIKPVAARHFVDAANLMQSLTQLKASGLMDDPGVRVHISGKNVATLIEEALNLEPYNLVSEYIGIAEEKEAASLVQEAQQQTMMEAQTPSGLTLDDTDEADLSPELALMQEAQGEADAELQEDVGDIIAQMQTSG